MTHDLLRVDRRGEGAAVVVRAVGEIDLVTVDLLSVQLTGAVQTVTPPGPVVVDLSAVTFLGSAGMAALIVTHRQCLQLGVFLRVVAQSVLTRRLALRGLVGVLTIRPTVSDALRVSDDDPHAPVT